MRTHPKINSVLVVAHAPYYGGTEKYAFNLVHALVERGVSVTLVTSNGPFVRHFSPLVKVYVVPLGWDYMTRRRAEKKIRNIAVKHSVQLIHAQCRTALVSCVFAGKTLGIPIVSHEHHMYDLDYYKRVVRELRNYTDRVLTIGPYMRRALIKHGLKKEKITAIRPGIDIRQFPPISAAEREEARKLLKLAPTDRVALSACRIKRDKGILELVQGFAEVRKHIRRAKLLIVGDDERNPYKLEVMKLIKTLKLEDSVYVCPGTFDLRQYHAAADVFVHPAIAKGMSVMEAMAVGLPVVGNKTVRKPLVVEDGKSGLMTESTKQFRMDPGEIAEKLIYLLRRPRTMRAMGGEARKRIAEHFSFNAHVGKVLRAYREVLKEAALRSFRRRYNPEFGSLILYPKEIVRKEAV